MKSRTWVGSRCTPYCSNVSLNSTAATLVAYEKCDYLSELNYKLVNQINDVETEKHFYKNKLNVQYRTHTSELEQAYTIINEKNNIILYMQQVIDKLKKQYRVLEDEYLCVKNNSVAEKQYFQKQIQNMQAKCRQKIKKVQETLDKEYELKLNRRIDEANAQCEKRVQLFKNQIQQLTQNSKQLAHQLKLMQDQYRQMLLKNDLMIQQSINRQLRKRDYQAQNNYLRDVSQYEALLKDKKQLKQEMDNMNGNAELLKRKNSQLQSLLQSQKTKYQDLVQQLNILKKQNSQLQSKNNSLNINLKQAFTTQTDTNTEQAFVPVVMPVDLDLISEIVGLKQFIVQKIVERFLDFFNKTAVTQTKKKSLSLTTFKNSLQTLKQTNPQNKILLYIQANMDRIIKLYCPTMTYNREFLTLKDEFIKKTLMECETIANPTQKLYRILQLLNRLKHPTNHINLKISTGQLRLVQMKFLAALKKSLNQNQQ